MTQHPFASVDLAARSALTERFSGTGSFARVEIASVPTRVTPMVAASEALGIEVLVKRDDETALPYGGNKVRKLEWILGDAKSRGADTLVTVGGTGSHHCLATAIYGRREGFDVHAVLFRQPWTEHVDETMRAFLAARGEPHKARSMASAAVTMGTLVARLGLTKKKTYVIGPGGSSPIGVLGYVDAGLELALQIDTGEVAEPDVIVVPAGSGGTVVGLSLGLAAAGVMTKIVAVRVTNRLAIHRRRLARLAAHTVALIRARDPRFPDVADLAMQNISIDVTHRGKAYGTPTEAGEHAAALTAKDGIVLDPTYTAKAFAALIALAEQKAIPRRALFLQTLNNTRMAPLLVGAPALPSWVRTS